ncbi:MAG TPA: class I SAM-dependent methyltransferase [Roseiflexaceae bacterium]|nr:class I SAM-dependent methyltransferase [Roseiflexaceae bacterium]
MLRKIKNLAQRRLFGEQQSIEADHAGREQLLQAMPNHAICAEIGVWEGDFSRRMLDRTRPAKLHLIDPWRYEQDIAYKDSLYGGQIGGNQARLDAVYARVCKRFAPQIVSGQVIVHRGDSHTVCEQFEDDYFDWIYIDGNHLYEFAIRDLHMFHRKVKTGGFLTGDDYSEGGWWQGGVKKAVDEFVAEGLGELVQIYHKQYILRK